MNAHSSLSAVDGWIDHDGGPCPLPWKTQVYLKFADGSESDRSYAAGWWERYWRPGKERGGIVRNHIAAYRFAVPLTDVIDLGPGRIVA